MGWAEQKFDKRIILFLIEARTFKKMVFFVSQLFGPSTKNQNFLSKICSAHPIVQFNKTLQENFHLEICSG